MTLGLFDRKAIIDEIIAELKMKFAALSASDARDLIRHLDYELYFWLDELKQIQDGDC